MTRQPITLTTTESVAKLAQLLLDVNHGGFPVVKTSSKNNKIFYGFINRYFSNNSLQFDAYISRSPKT